MAPIIITPRKQTQADGGPSGFFVIVGGNQISTTDDAGETWVPRTVPGGVFGLTDVAHNFSDLWVAVGNSGEIVSSPDAINWTKRTSGTASNLFAVSYDTEDGMWVAMGAGTSKGVLVTSTNGIDWTFQGEVFEGTMTSVFHDSNNTWMATTSNQQFRSGDGVNWANIGQALGLESVTWFDLTHNRQSGISNGKWIICGGRLAGNGMRLAFTTIPLVDSFTEILSPFATGSPPGGSPVTSLVGSFEGIASDRVSKWVTVGDSGRIALSTDNGDSFTAQTSPTGTTLHEVATDGQTWVAVGDSGVLVKSDDGVNWVTRDSGFGIFSVNGVAASLSPIGSEGPPPEGSPPGASYFDEVIADGPIAYWRLGETGSPAPTVAVDSAGGSPTIDGTYINSPTLGAGSLLIGDSDPAVTFNGTDQLMKATRNFDGATAITLECLIHSASYTTTGNDYVFSVPEASVANGIDFRINNNTLSVDLVTSGGSSLGTIQQTITNGVVYHIVITYDGSTLRAFANNIEMLGSPVSITGGITAADGNIYLAALHDVGGFHTSITIDEAAVYDFALSTTRITAHYNASV